ncbi:MAG TPA: hypothetical protein VKR83_19905, partial [Ktedonobacteraceae bacterium]|nr:hypothetical protein [Ktedonobacteraceae bacterium]
LPGVARLANVYNVDTTSGRSEQLTPTIQSTEEVQFETVSPDGKNMLYDYSEQGQTIYSTLQPVSNRSYITSIANDDVSNAIWMDNDHILVARVHSGVEELDIHTGAPVQYFASLMNIHLLFYHSPYLYFQDAQQTVMFRSNLLTGERKQLTSATGGVNFTNCVLNPDGSRLYCEAQSNQFSRFGPGLYMVNSDGSGLQSLNRRGILLGFTPDRALLFLQAASNNYQVVKLGQGTQQDQVLLKNAAPTTALIGPGDVMLAPDGHGLIVQDGNQDDTPRGVWYDDLTAKTSRELFTYAPDANGHLIGWDQLLVKGAAPVPGVNVTPTATAPGTPTVPVLDPFGGWNGVVLITGTGTTYHFVSSYNYLNGDHRLLANLGANIQFDGVASSGLDMLYHVDIGQRTLFYTLHQLPGQGYFYESGQDNVLNAIWMPDSIHALIATIDAGVIEVNTQTGLAQPFLPSLRVQALKFYRDGYLYFLGGPDRSVDTLFRIDITSGVVQQVTAHSTGGDFWLSPDGLTVYYKNEGPAGQAGIYAMSSDGTRGGVIRGDGTPIGYAPDDSLVIMREVDHRFQVVQLGATPQQDRVLLSDAAPGAISLCAPSFVGETASISGETICDTTNVALAPYGHALIVVASYANGSSKVWSDDLATGKQFVMLTPSPATTLIVPGWDRIEVP